MDVASIFAAFVIISLYLLLNFQLLNYSYKFIYNLVSKEIDGVILMLFVFQSALMVGRSMCRVANVLSSLTFPLPTPKWRPNVPTTGSDLFQPCQKLKKLMTSFCTSSRSCFCLFVTVSLNFYTFLSSCKIILVIHTPALVVCCCFVIAPNRYPH